MYSMSEEESKIVNIIYKIPTTKDEDIKLLNKMIADIQLKLQNTTNDAEKINLSHKLTVLMNKLKTLSDLDGGRRKRKRRTKRKRHSRRRRTIKTKK